MGTMDGYRRVSRVMDRKGESYMSPSIQQDDIERWAAEHGITIPNLEDDGYTLEEDVSGATPIDKRKLGKLIKRVEAGISEGVVVNHIDRFGRDKVDAALAIKRLHEAGARLVAIGEAIDTATSPSLVVDIYLSLAEEVRARACENWDNAKRRNVEVRGLHVSSKPKFGYRRTDEVEWPDRPEDGRLIAEQPEDVKEAWKQRTIRDARLVIEPTEAAVVLEVFEMRAKGEPWVNCNTRAEAMLGKEVARNLASRTVECRVYLGEASAVVKDRTKPKSTNATERITQPDAHEAIVTPELFAAANRTKEGGSRMPNDGSLAAQALLSGVVHCATCGQKMYVRGRGRNGQRKAFYSCARKMKIGQLKCENPANADAKMVDDYVVWVLGQDVSGACEGVGTVERHWLEAREALHAAEADLTFWKDSDASAETRRTEIVRADSAVATARARMWELEQPADVPDETVTLDGRLIPYRPWGEDRDADQRFLRRYVGRVTVARGNRWQPLGERIKVAWVDGSEPVLADDVADAA
jgi:DNA invertase Pin-like site-specific DNA recombinase